MNGHQLRAIGKCCFHLNFLHHLWNTLHDVTALQECCAIAHKISHAAPVASTFNNLVGEDGNALGVIELETALLVVVALNLQPRPPSIFPVHGESDASHRFTRSGAL